MIKNIAFDFGGVIFNLDYEGAVESFKRIGLADADQRLDRYHQRGIFEELESGRIKPDAFRKELSQMCHRELTHDEVLSAWLGYVDVQRWAESPAFCDYGRPLSSCMDKCYTSYEVGIMKPAEGIFRHMLIDAAILPSETLFLDDSAANVEAAARLGIHTLLVEKNADWRADLNRCLGS